MLHGIIDDFDSWGDLDRLQEGLAAFPEDSELLLAAGSRYELLWWRSAENTQRAVAGGQLSSRNLLVRASEYLRRSVAANPDESEARLRLARVLGELGDYRGGLAALDGVDWSGGGPFAYLARLIEGDLHERSGDIAAASAAYDKAILLARVPQSARIAKAYLEHQSGARQDAVEEVLKATSLPLDENDPWWPYLRGQLWRRDPYLKRLRSMVQP
jgi:tetratricopeptide (TPR) repeat protein